MSSAPEAIMSFSSVAHAIQLALAPVFLLTGIAGLLNVMASRLARIIDRGRSLTEQPLPAHLNSNPDTLHRELTRLERRRHYASLAITACTFSALLVCMVVAVIFLQVLVQMEFKWLISTLFTASTITLIVGLGYFLREVHLATRTVRINIIEITK